MSSSYPFSFPLANGLHARPASHLQAVANRFKSEVTLRAKSGAAATAGNGRERSGNAKSVLSMVSLDVQMGDPCVLVATGADEAQAIEELGRFVREVLPTTDDVATPTGDVGAQEVVKLPRSLKATGLGRYYRGTIVSSGVGRGATVIGGSGKLEVSSAGRKSGDPAEERKRLEVAIEQLRTAMLGRVKAAARSQEREVLGAHVAILEDIELRERSLAFIAAGSGSAAMAVVESADHFASVLGHSKSAYLRERAMDIRDVCGQLLEALGEQANTTRTKLTGPTIYVAENLAPSELLRLEREHLKGLVLRDGGATSHTVILARSMGIPTLVGVEEIPGGFRQGEDAVVDGELGIAIPELNEKASRYYAQEARKIDSIRRSKAARRFAHAETRDGHLLEIGCNVASAHEVAPAMEAGADGIGLFRTEMLFVERSGPPTEDEQYEQYLKAAKDADGRAVIVRLVDIGGDKHVEYLRLAEEENPFLGYRGVRIYEEHRALLRAQIRAILRAGVHGGILRMLVPMIATVDELRMVKAMVASAKAELDAEGKLYVVPQIGVMIEVPAAVMLVSDLAREADFFSIGSNDLTQYCMAADRGNSKVAGLGSWAQPAFLRMLKLVVDESRAGGGKRPWVGLCGEMGDNPEALPLLVGLGLDEISVSAPRIASAKSAVEDLTFSACVQLLQSAVACATRAEVEAVLKAAAGTAAPLPMLSDDLVLIDCDARSKEEAIKALCDALAVGGWTDKSALVEEAVWAREDTYSTGFGHGFAVPHCKSNDMKAHAIGVARLQNPVAWGSIDGAPVDVVILLAIRSDSQERAHMKVFSQLSRLTMRDEFRNQVRAEAGPAELRAFLESSLFPGMAAATTTNTENVK